MTKIGRTKKYIVLMMSFLLLVTIYPINISAEQNNEMQLTYNFETPLLETIEIDGKTFSRIQIEDTISLGEVGQPRLPVKAAKILLPQKSQVKKVEVTGEKKYLASNIIVEPSLDPKQINTLEQSIDIDNTIYESTELFPQKNYEIIGTQSYKGYNILVLNLYPVQYIGDTGEIYYYNSITVSVECEEKTEINRYFRNLDDDKEAVEDIVDNPDLIDTYLKKSSYDPGCSILTNDNYDYVIITTEKLEDLECEYNLEALMQAHNLLGLDCNLVTVEDIYEVYPGDNNPSKIKLFIADAYSNANTQYILLAGDTPDIPVNYIEITFLDGSKRNVPADQWYTTLDSDLYPELSIGRACVDNKADVERFVYKTLKYMSENENECRDVFLLGEQLDYRPTYGGDYMEELIGTCSNNGVDSVGFSTNRYNIHELFDRDVSGEWTKEYLTQQLNQNEYSIINHLGHSYYNYNIRLYNSDVSYVKNTNPLFVYSQGCLAGGFDNPEGDECFAETFTVKTGNGAFAGIWNSREGLYASGGTCGPTQYFNRAFWDAVFDDGVTEIGSANQRSKTEYASYCSSNPYLAFCYWEITLFGDPAVNLKIPDEIPSPDTPSKPEGKTDGTSGERYSYRTSTQDPQGQKIYYLWDWDDGTQSEWLGPFDSGETCSASHSWTVDGGYQIKVKAKNEDGRESQWSQRLQVSMPRAKSLDEFSINEFIQRLQGHQLGKILSQFLSSFFYAL